MMTSLPLLEDTLVDLLQYGDTGALHVQQQLRRWTFYVQAGALVGLEREPGPPRGDDEDPTTWAAGLMAEAMRARDALWDFEEGQGPADFGIFDARHALPQAMSEARNLLDLLRRLQPVMHAWPRLTVDADTLTDNPSIQRWLRSLDGLGPGDERFTHAPTSPGLCLAVVWVAWKMGDLELGAWGHAAEELIDDMDEVAVEIAAERAAERVAESAVATPAEPGSTPAARYDASRPAWGPEQPSNTGGRALRNQTVGKESGVRTRPGPDPTLTHDPLVEGIVLARAGQTLAALALLEAAWTDNPDQAGLEEWMAYARFSANRERDPAAARTGLATLRDVMHRTDPVGDLRPLPWLLMARAQLERGDLVQARTILDQVLDRNVENFDAQELDEQLRAREAEAEAHRTPPRREPASKTAVALGLLVLLAAILISVQVVQPPPQVRPNHASEYAQVVKLERASPRAGRLGRRDPAGLARREFARGGRADLPRPGQGRRAGWRADTDAVVRRRRHADRVRAAPAIRTEGDAVGH